MAVTYTLGGTITTNLPDDYNPRWIGQTYAVDLNNDGNDDLVVVGASYPFDGPPVPQPSFVAFGNGNGGFTTASQSVFPFASLTTVHPREVIFEDFNGDGFKDMYVGDHGFDANPFPGAQNKLFLSNGDGTWRDATASLPQVSDFTHSADAGDVDGDGDLDILVGNTPQPNPVDPYVLLNNGQGAFTQAGILPTGNGQLLYVNNLRMTSALLEDLDGDGRAELVVGSAFSTTQNPEPARIVWNHGGTFAAGDNTALPLPSFFGANHSVYDIKPIDVNHDGLKDLLVLYQGDVWLGGWEIQVLVNNGNETFSDQTATYFTEAGSSNGGAPSQNDAQSQYWMQFLHMRDVNGDGRMDFTVDIRGTVQAPGTIPIAYIQQADNTFDAIRVSEFNQPWLLDYTAQYVEWDDGSGFIHFSAWDDKVHITTQEIEFHAVNPPLVPQPLTRVGTAGDDHLFGASANDTLSGLEGNDHFTGNAGDDAIDGGAGLDAAILLGAQSMFDTSSSGGTITVQGEDGTDTLTGVERLHFTDASLAFDIEGNAGSVARILGAVFGPSAVDNPAYAGIGLALMDGGMSFAAVVSLAMQVRFGAGASDETVVAALYENVVGSPASPDDVAGLAWMIDMGYFTQASIGVFAAQHAYNAVSVDLAGLAASGLEYFPAVV